MKKVSFLICGILLFSLYSPIEAQQRPTVALVLAGGGAWGLAHIGAIKVLEETGIPIDIVVGTSMGAIIGAFYSIGYSPTEMESIANNTHWAELFNENLLSGTESLSSLQEKSRYIFSSEFDTKGIKIREGLIAGNRIMRFLDILFLGVPSQTDFDNFPRRYRAVATDILSGKTITLSQGNLSEAVRASMSLPAIFTPFRLDDTILVDGGVTDNLPITIARNMGADIVIAVDLVNGKEFDADAMYRTPGGVLTRTIEIMRQESSLREKEFADICISIDMQDFLPTQFELSEPLILEGEKTTRKYMPEILELIDRFPQLAWHTEKPKLLDASPITSVVVEGGTSKDKQLIYSFFNQYPGSKLKDEDWGTLFSLIDSTGKFVSTRILNTQETSSAPLTLKLETRQEKKNLLHLGFFYESTMSSVITRNIDIIPAITIRGLTTNNSLLFAEVELLDAPGVSIRFDQDIGSFLSISPFYRYARDFTTRLTKNTVAWQYQTNLQNMGIEMSFTPAAGFALRTGIQFDVIDYDVITEIPSAPAGSYFSLVTSSLEYIRLDSLIFPMQGVDVSFNATVSVPVLGSSNQFIIAGTSGNTFLSLGTPFSLALLWEAGTDFSLSPTSMYAAPLWYKPAISSRRLFPGPLYIEERKGSHVAAIGLEAKQYVNWDSRGIKFPVFILANGAIGCAVQDFKKQDLSGIFEDLIYGTVNAGAGIRFNNAFGLTLKVGMHISMYKDLLPYITFDVGTLGKKLYTKNY